MTETQATQQHPELEQKLEALYGAASPAPDFAARLEMQLARRAVTLERQSAPQRISLLGRIQSLFRRPALAAAVAAVLLLAALVSLAGPQKVLAQVARLFGYAPGAGFVEPGSTRILPTAVTVRRGEVTLRVDSVVADSRQTQVILTASGLPHEKFDLPEGQPSKDTEPYLLLPGGARLDRTFGTSGIGDVLQASLTFPPLLETVSQVTLVLPRLPSLPAGFAPENWSVPLALEGTRSAGTASAPGVALGQSYAPGNASQAANGATVSLLQVGQSSDETGLQVQFDWDDPAWTWLSSAELRLADETGRSYVRRTPELGAAFEPGGQAARPGSRTNTYRFDPFDPGARTGVLTIDSLLFTIQSGAKFSFNPGRDARPGQTWDLSQAPGSHLEVAGVPVQVLSAEVIENPNTQKAPREDRYLFSLLVETTPAAGRAIDNLSISPAPDPVSNSCEILPGNRLKLTVGLAEIPNRPLTLYLAHGEVRLTGPWTITWDLPALKK